MPNSGSEPFEALVSLLDYPMFVVTTRADDEKSGCLVGFGSQTSINPPRFLIGLSKKNRTFRIAQDATHLGVHVVTRDHVEVARLFGSETGDEIDKFTRCDWHEGPEGVPVLDAAGAWFVGTILHRFDVGDHVAHILEPIAGNAPDDVTNWVTFSDVRDIEPGHEA